MEMKSIFLLRENQTCCANRSRSLRRWVPPYAERNGLFWKTKDESPSPGVAWTNPGWECLFLLSCTNFFLLSGENGGKECYDPEF
jgi:hypothetical protein